MPDFEGGSDQVDEGQFDDVEWELCSSAREAGVLLLPFPERPPWGKGAHVELPFRRPGRWTAPGAGS